MSRCLLALALLLASMSMPVGATVLQLEEDSLEALRLEEQPVHGMTKSQVLARFGEPTRRHAPRGGGDHPLIYRWDYPEFSVYFEGRHVLHTVVPAQDDNGGHP